jgi:hypothetical protein
MPSAVIRCWILIKNTRWSGGGYVKRRIAEEMRRRNISVKLVHPMKCDLLISKDGLEDIVYAGERIALPDCVIPRVGAMVDYFGLVSITLHHITSTRAAHRPPCHLLAILPSMMNG